MSVKRSKSSRRSFRRPSRTQLVWITFLASMALVIAVLASQPQQSQGGGFLLTSLDSLSSGSSPAVDPILKIAKPLDRQRWTGIVIHHLGEPAGDAESVNRKHIDMGLQGLGYHFLIGNGNGLGDGVVHVGFRWDQQLPGAHAAGPQSETHNQHSISICLIGNGERRAFTDRQMEQLTSLVRRLQAEFHIPARNVWLHRDLTSQTTSPGKFFAAARFQEQLRD